MYINAYYSITIQPTSEDDFFWEEDKLLSYNYSPIPSHSPEYKTLIPPLQLRRLNKSMRMALFCGLKISEKLNSQKIDAIMVGTGLGCLRDSEKFTETVLDDELSTLNPTPFIQSTHNMASATLALALDCKGYNMTYVHDSHSFESTLVDARLYLKENKDQTLLIGAVDEIGEQTPKFWSLIDWTRKSSIEIPDTTFGEKGEISAEGAAFFALKAEKDENSIAKIVGYDFSYSPESPLNFVKKFLDRNSIKDYVVILGKNGDQNYDHHYEELENKLFSSKTILTYKNLIGEFDTAQSIAFSIACQIFEKGQIPTALIKQSGDILENPPYIILYNQRKGKHHSVILIENCKF